MRLVKKINNNFALALDSSGEEVIVSGKGVGFLKLPMDITDLSMINRTYYDIDKKYIGLLNELPEDIISVSAKITDYAKSKLKTSLNPNMVFTLADHINFSIERNKKGNIFTFPLSYDFEQLYPKELEVAKYAMKIIKNDLGVELSSSESIGIAMNIVNAESFISKKDEEKEFIDLIEELTKIVENYFDIELNKNSFNFSRFITHLRYLFKRLSEKRPMASENHKMYQVLSINNPRTNECVNKIENYFRRKKNWKLDDEEKLYLILHVNRVISREDCNRKGITSDTE
ncbi:beta-glucoside operon transcriptional antiterminator [Enterococcus sp. AZ067]|uniref:PRD domain-containing protein n=1 Tax=Enterococcus sp. AZ067 TaxID=2774674 RepID=UPI003F2125FA